jgi:putative ABC transport system permease protein
VVEQAKSTQMMKTWLRRLETVRQDVRIALRTLRKNAGFTTVAMVSLAIGIGVNSAVFSIINAILLKPFPYPHAERLVAIWEKRPDGQRTAMSTLNYLDYAARSTVFENVAATTGCCAYVMLGDGGAPTRLTALHVSATYFDVLGATPAMGRTFASGDDQVGRDHVVVLSHKLWASHFGADETLVGRAIRLDGHPYTVIGVMPAGGPFDRTRTQIWLPLAFAQDRMNRSSHWLLTVTGGALGRLKAGVTAARARVELEAIGAQLSAEYPSSNRGWSAVVEPYAGVVAGKDLPQSLYLLFAAVGTVLLIGCVNLANVMLARALARDREIAVRAALGASRGRLVQQFLTESLLLSIGGGTLGLLAAYGLTATLNVALARLPMTMATLPILIPAEAMIGVDWRVLLFTWTLCMATGVGFGLAPAFTAARTAHVGVGGRASTAVVHRRLRGALVVAEVAFAFVLLTNAGLLIRSFFRMRGAETGFDVTNVLTAEMPVKDHRFATAAQFHGFVRQVIDAVEAIPGVSEVAFTDGMPLQGTPTLAFFQIAGRPRVERSERPAGNFKVVSPGYLRALGLRLRRGRWLSDLDREETSRVAVINATMARVYFPNEDPVGHYLLMNQPGLGFVFLGQEVPWEVIGVIADERLTPFDDRESHPAIYVSNEQSPTPFAGFVVRGSTDPSHLEKQLRQAIAAVDPDQPVSDVKTLEQLKDESMTPDRLRSSLLSLFAAMALLLSGAGIYGVVSYLVAHRTHELGIRAALGASRASLVTLVVGPGMAQAALGLAVGCLGAYATTRLLNAFLFGVGPSDAPTFVATGGVLAGVALVACYVPARRAARVNPLSALRAE